MNGYVARLMHQSAVKIASGDTGARAQSSASASGAGPPLPDIVEEETLREAPRPEQPTIPAVHAHELQNITAASFSPARTGEAPTEHGKKYGAVLPKLESPRVAQSVDAPGPPAAGAIPFVSIGQTEQSAAPNEQMPGDEPYSFVTDSPAGEEISFSTPGAQEIVHEVVAWVTDTRSPATEVEPTEQVARTSPMVVTTPARDAPASQIESGRRSLFRADDSGKVDPSERAVLPFAEARSSAPPVSQPEPWSVQIDSIHLTIEAPAAKPALPPVEPRVIPPAATALSPVFTPSRLRRHYLRPF